ncbi:transglycosylase domain-containing protein [Lysobacter capsici]|uniref:transglycosylase domain-containing protein n=1 Tax=Lysobacter capsici TaxID=435897 RepID=UPI000BBB47E2|nr:transglycosylase domain-containing protein [Lysobacter capsici]ATE71335.1 hypothetical protein CNO08_08205 [Lysobacter capsici]UOF16639.1 transglycosylase domain-containing protein [Lysobacter capsici]
MDVLIKSIVAAILAIALTVVLVLQGIYWYGAYDLPQTLPLPRQQYSAQARALMWTDLGGKGELRIRRFSSVGLPLTELGHGLRCWSHAWSDWATQEAACAAGADEEVLSRAADDIAFLNLAQADPRLGPNLKYGRNRDGYRPWPKRLRPVTYAVASRLSREWPAERVIDWILDNSDYGQGAMGLEQAAQTYFGVPADELREAELVALIVFSRGPRYYDPACEPEHFRNGHLRLMLDRGYRVTLSDPDADLSRMKRWACPAAARLKPGTCPKPD